MYYYIIVGSIFSLSLKYAGTGNEKLRKIILVYL